MDFGAPSARGATFCASTLLIVLYLGTRRMGMLNSVAGIRELIDHLAAWQYEEPE
jgi:hypothetical protein